MAVYLIVVHIIVDVYVTVECSECPSLPSSRLFTVDYMDIGHIIVDVYVTFDCSERRSLPLSKYYCRLRNFLYVSAIQIIVDI